MHINIIILEDGKNQERPSQSSSIERGKRCLYQKLMRRVANLSQESLTSEKYKQTL
jgi:hypothetical protein